MALRMAPAAFGSRCKTLFEAGACGSCDRRPLLVALSRGIFLGLRIFDRVFPPLFPNTNLREDVERFFFFSSDSVRTRLRVVEPPSSRSF